MCRCFQRLIITDVVASDEKLITGVMKFMRILDKV
jgi:hypothetical protein